MSSMYGLKRPLEYDDQIFVSIHSWKHNQFSRINLCVWCRISESFFFWKEHFVKLETFSAKHRQCFSSNSLRANWISNVWPVEWKAGYILYIETYSIVLIQYSLRKMLYELVHTLRAKTSKGVQPKFVPHAKCFWNVVVSEALRKKIPDSYAVPVKLPAVLICFQINFFVLLYLVST